jgi:hypothetical protein
MARRAHAAPSGLGTRRFLGPPSALSSQVMRLLAHLRPVATPKWRLLTAAKRTVATLPRGPGLTLS